MSGFPATYRDVLAEHRARLLRVSEGGGLRRLQRVYDKAQAELEVKLRKLYRAGRKNTFTADQARGLLAQVRQGQTMIAGQMAGELGELSHQAQIEAVRGLQRDLVRVDGAFSPVGATSAAFALPIEEASRFSGVIRGRRQSLLRQHASSMTNWGAHTVKKIEDELSLALLTGDSTDEAIGRVAAAADAEWYRAERVIRTETAWAFNAAAADGVLASAEVLPDLRLRWVELCDDESGAPLDDRVAVDSIAMHGQVALDGVFTMPGTAPVPDSRGDTKVPDALVGETWPHPPDRPHDRAVVQAWRPGWGVPAWEWRGRRVKVGVKTAKPARASRETIEVRSRTEPDESPPPAVEEEKHTTEALAKDETLGVSTEQVAHARAAAADVFQVATRTEPSVTSAMRTLEGDDANLVGLQWAVKSEASTRRKILDLYREFPQLSEAEAASRVRDSVRYTLQLDPATYADQVERKLAQLEAKGFEVVKLKNYWDSEIYQGVNVFMRTPDGLTMELQFHTEASYRAKEATHKAFEEYRLASTSPERAKVLHGEMAKVQKRITAPRGVAAIKPR